jgi:hypothetical protein
MALFAPAAGLDPGGAKSAGDTNLAGGTKSAGGSGGNLAGAKLRHHLTNLLIALSVGTLVFIRRWYDLERLEPQALGYLRAVPIDRTLLVSTVLSGLITTAVFWLAWTWVERHPTPFRKMLGQCVFLLVMATSLESVRRYWNSEGDHFDWMTNVSMLVIEGLCGLGLVTLLLGRPRILLAARRVALFLTLLLPALLFDFGSNALTASFGPTFEDRPPLPRLAVNPNAPRLIWLVFDELDQRFAFDQRPADLELPELDLLRGESVTAGHAVETSSWTAFALPSLISGRVFVNARMIDAQTLKLAPEGGGPEVEWSSQPSVFKSAREIGVNAALVGWLHPYCRVLGDELVSCLALPSSHSTTALVHEVRAARAGVLRTVPHLFARNVLTLLDLFRFRGQSLAEQATDGEIQEEQQQQFFAVRDRALADAADPGLGLVFVHVPTPHMFPIYNRRAKNFDLRGATDYFDNLALVDRTVGELRQSLKKSGLEDRTAILITADHGFRPDNWRGRKGWTPEFDRLTAGGASLTVPLILRLPGKREHAGFDPPISNVISGDLGLAVLRGEVTTTGQAVAWLERHAQDRESAAARALSSAKR